MLKEGRKTLDEGNTLIGAMKVAIQAFARSEVQEILQAAVADEIDGLAEVMSSSAQDFIDIESKKIMKIFSDFSDLLMGFTKVITEGATAPMIPETVAALMHRARMIRSKQQGRAGHI